RRFSFGLALATESLALATLACKEPWGLIGMLALRTVPPYLEMRSRGAPTRVYSLHMGLFGVLLVVGLAVGGVEGRAAPHSWLALVPLLGAVFIRSGVAPFHCWVTDLFEHATFGGALLFVTPMFGAFLAVRLVLPIAPDWALSCIGMMALFTAVYAAGM